MLILRMCKGGLTMKKCSFGESRWKHFWKRNGVYFILTMSLVAVGAVLISGFGMSESDSPIIELPQETPVEQNVTGQLDDRTTTTTTTATSTTTTQAEAAELYVLPLTNTVQKPFSADAPLYSVTMDDWRIHTGVDFAGEAGQTVKATAQGRVSAVEEDPMWGCVVTIDHGVGVVSRYFGIEPAVRVGDKLDVADTVGLLTTVPCEAAQTPHLHFEMTIDGVPVDPVEAIALEVRYGETTNE